MVSGIFLNFLFILMLKKKGVHTESSWRCKFH